MKHTMIRFIFCVGLISNFCFTTAVWAQSKEAENMASAVITPREVGEKNCDVPAEYGQNNRVFNGIFRLLDTDEKPLSDIAYQVIEQNGTVIAQGFTDRNGATVRVYSNDSEVRIAVTHSDWEIEAFASDLEEITSIEEPDDSEADKLCISLGTADIVFRTYFASIEGLRFRLTTPQGEVFPGETSSSGGGMTLILHDHCKAPLYYIDAAFSEPVEEIISSEGIMPIAIEVHTGEDSWKNIGSFELESGKVKEIAVQIDIREYPFHLSCPVF